MLYYMGSLSVLREFEQAWGSRRVMGSSRSYSSALRGLPDGGGAWVVSDGGRGRVPPGGECSAVDGRTLFPRDRQVQDRAFSTKHNIFSSSSSSLDSCYQHRQN